MIAARALLALAAVCIATPAIAQTPKTFRDIPVYPGATRVAIDSSTDVSSLEMRTQAGDSLPIRSSETAAYEIAAHPEAVFSFYRQRLGGNVEYGMEDTDFESLARGAATPVIRGENFHDMTDQPGDLGIEAVSAARKRALFLGRQPLGPDQYFSDGGFEWMVKETNGDISRLGIHISDAGLEPWTRYTPRTRLVIARTTYVDPATAGQDADDRRSSEMEIAIRKDVEALGAGPDQATLGVPPYPGATFDARNSAGMSRGETKYYFYFTNDDVASVVAFYQQRLGKAPTDVGGGEQGFVLEGRMPFPAHGVFVKPNTTMPGGRTVITVVRRSD